MFLHFSRSFTRTVIGRRWHQVVCDKCQTAYHYELVRTGTGTGTSHYLIAQDAARQRAANAANRDLDKRLDRDAELVPCPKCKWVNDDLVRRFRRGLYPVAPWASFTLLILGGGIFWGILNSANYEPDRLTPGQRTTLIVTAAACVAIPILAFLARALVRRRVDPNALWPSAAPLVPLGTPPAIIESLNPATRQPQHVPISAGQEPPHHGWAVYRPGQLTFPATCCHCMAPDADRLYKSPFKVKKDELSLPLCDACKKRSVLLWFATAVACLVTIAGALWTTMSSLNPRDDEGPWALSSVFAFFLFIAALAYLPTRLARPYRLRVADKRRCVWRLRVDNAAYNALLLDQVEVTQGRAAPQNVTLANAR